MSKIYAIKARSIYDSNGWPTVETTVWLDDGAFGVSSVPAAPQGTKTEPVEIRDGDTSMHLGRGVQKAISNVNQIISPSLKGKDPSQQSQVDQVLLELDGTANKSKLGVNAILSVSQAVCKAGAASFHLPLYDYLGKKYQLIEEYTLPTPIVTMINGGKHGNGNLDFQEFHLIPSSRHRFADAFRISSEIYHAVERSLMESHAIHSVGGQGGFTPNLYTNLDAMEIIYDAVKKTGHFAGQDVFLGIDASADTLLRTGKYVIKDRSKAINAKELADYYKDLNSQYHLFVLEDPFASSDWNGWQQVTFEIGKDTLIIADKLTTGNSELINQAVSKKSCTAVVVKPNQIGTVTEVIKVINQIKAAGLSVVVAHRLGETNDTFAADLSVGVGAGYVKFGAPARGERVIKYNRLLQIDEMLQTKQS